MVAPVQHQTVVQAGKEVTAGTLVAATHVVDHTPGTFSFKRDRATIAVRNAGSRHMRHRTYPGQETVEIEYAATAAFDRLPFYGQLFLAGAPTVGTGNPAATWAFTTIQGVTENLASYSFEVGGTNYPNAYTVTGVRGRSLEIDIKHDQPWQMKVGLVGMVTAAGATLTSSLSLPSNSHGGGQPLRDALGTQTKVFIDAATIGSTQAVGRIVSANIKLDLDMNPRHTLDGTNTPYRIAETGPFDVQATIVAEYDAQTDYTAWAAKTAQLVRIQATGDSLGATNYISQFNLYGVWDGLVLGEDNGVVTTQLTLLGQYANTPASTVTASFTNSVSALP